MSGRIRKSRPNIKCNASNYRTKALPYLKKDFGCRCAYSMVFLDLAGGETCMEVDHFKPKRKFPRKAHSYSNLMLVSRHCNGNKGDEWPSYVLKKQGFEFINPCKEQDYGKHIFENIETGELVPATPKGAYQIEKCMLNASHLVNQRLDRTKLKRLLEQKTPITIPYTESISEGEKHLKELNQTLTDIKSKYIPYIPPLPKNSI